MNHFDHSPTVKIAVCFKYWCLLFKVLKTDVYVGETESPCVSLDLIHVSYAELLSAWGLKTLIFMGLQKDTYINVIEQKHHRISFNPFGAEFIYVVFNYYVGSIKML